MSRFFIRRPIFAMVISIALVVAGIAAFFSLPIAKFPPIAPPTVSVQAVYPGGDAETVAQTVATPIEQQVNGVEGMIYMSSTSASDGTYNLTVTFEVGTDMDIAAVLVQNRVAIAEPSLPQEVRAQGVTTKKKSPQTLQFIALTAEEGSVADDPLFLSNYAATIKDELSRVDGVGEVQVFGVGDYSMRIWLDPRLLDQRGLTTEEVMAAISEQNVQVAAGQVGGAPAPTGTAFQYSVLAQGRLKTVEEFENIIITQGEAGRSLRVKDVARVELGAKTYSFDSRFNQGPAALISIYQLPGANAMSTAERVRERMAELAGSSNWPAGVNYQVPFDTTAFVSASIDEVYSTLVMAVVLVVLVIFVFLQDWRATVIPVVAIPVSLIGTFLVLAALGFSINMLTLFGVVLAIGIVVDDAIVVVENTSRFLADGFEPKEAAARAMDEITGPVIATTLVLLAVFVPTAFMGGITGQLFRQFALTISGAVLISTVNALTLSPALCGLLLRKPREPWFVGFRWFNRVFDSATSLYARVIGGLLRVTALVLIVYVGLVGLAGWSLGRLPTGFVPQEDQGYLFVNVQLPDGATLQRTREVMGDLESLVAETPGVADIVNVAGYSLLGGYAGSNTGFVVAILEPWEQRRRASLQIDAIQAELRERFSRVRGAIAFAFQPPAIDGLGVAGGFQLEVLDQGGAGSGRLQLVAQDLAATGNAQSRLQGLSTTFRANVPQLYVDIDRARVKQLDIPLSSVFRSLQGYLGSAYVNDFTYNNRSYQVRLQADAAFRSDRRDIGKLKVRNRQGQMVPLAAVLDVQEALGPSVISRFQMYPSASINGSAARGVSSGEALSLMEELATSRLPPGFGYAWTGMSYQERQAASGQAVVLALSVLAVFLVLAAQYESWLSPAAVIAVVPLAALGVVLALLLRGSDNNTYTQIGLVLLIALASKNAILIVEFANEKRDQGLSPREASREAARLRFRAILMTAFSSILGFLPLLIAAGAGAASRQAVGNAVVGGMIAATIFSLLLVPSFAFIAQWVGARLSGNGRTAAATADESADG